MINSLLITGLLVAGFASRCTAQSSSGARAFGPAPGATPRTAFSSGVKPTFPAPNTGALNPNLGTPPGLRPLPAMPGPQALSPRTFIAPAFRPSNNQPLLPPPTFQPAVPPPHLRPVLPPP